MLLLYLCKGTCLYYTSTKAYFYCTRTKVHTFTKPVQRYAHDLQVRRLNSTHLGSDGPGCPARHRVDSPAAVRDEAHGCDNR
jgi:hypothetical protein